jgi:hypothetical protein
VADIQIDFGAPASLRKWPSLKNERISASWGATPYLIVDGTLDVHLPVFDFSGPLSMSTANLSCHAMKRNAAVLPTGNNGTPTSEKSFVYDTHFSRRNELVTVRSPSTLVFHDARGLVRDTVTSHFREQI